MLVLQLRKMETVLQIEAKRSSSPSIFKYYPVALATSSFNSFHKITGNESVVSYNNFCTNAAEKEYTDVLVSAAFIFGKLFH